MNEVPVFDLHLMRWVDGVPRHYVGIFRRVTAPPVFKSTDIVSDHA